MSSLEPWLLEILVCPRCQGELVAESVALRCDACRVRYPVEDGIPQLLPESAVSINSPAVDPPAQ